MRARGRKIGSAMMAVIMTLSLLPMNVTAAGTTECSGGGDCVHEAAITATHYDTLAEALSAAEEGQTVKLLKDIDNSVDDPNYEKGINYSLKAGTTLDGDGHTISGHIGVHIPAAGAAVTNVKFVDIHNDVVVDQSLCDRYGWTSKTGNQSAIYASSLTGKAAITNCAFDNIDWDAIQITPEPTASIEITGNVFQHTNTTETQLRYVHIENTGVVGTAIQELTITDNQFYTTENPNDLFCSIGVWGVNKNTSTLQISGNYVEDYATTEINYIDRSYLFPARSQPTVDTDDYQPVAYDSNSAGGIYFSLQDAVDKTAYYVRLMADEDQGATIPEGKAIAFYSYGHTMGTLTNNGELTVYGSDVPDSGSRIVNNGTLRLSGNSATVYEVENNGTLEITSGATYDLSKITGSGTVSLTGGTFSTEPSAAQLAPWYKAVEQSGEPVTYKVSKMTIAEGLAAGMVATSSSSGGSFYTSVTEGVNSTSATYLQTDSSEDVLVSAPYATGRSLYTNGHSFTGSITIKDGCDFLNLLGSSFDLKYASGDRLRIGFYSTAADVTIQDADLDQLEVNASGDCTITGGNYGGLVAHTYYKVGDTEPTYTAQLSITGGSFASDTVTVQYANHTPKTETVPLSDYVAEGYVVVAGTGAYPYQVVEKSDTPAEVVPAAPSVTVPEGNEAAEQLAEQLERTEDLVSAGSLSMAASSTANSNTLTGESPEVTGALNRDNITVGADETVTIVIQPYMDVEIKEVSATEGSKVLKLDIAPKYNVVATTAVLAGDDPEDIVIADEGVVDANAAIIKAGQPMTITQPVEVTLPLPGGFVSDTTTPVYVQHKGYEYTATVTSSGEEGSKTYTASFNNPHGFSEFTITTAREGVASVDGTVYTSFQAAVDAAQSGDTITVVQAGEGETFTASITGTDSKSVQVKNESDASITVTINGVSQTIGAGATSEAFIYTYTPSSGGGGGGSTRYTVTVEDSGHGTVTSSHSRASRGTTVTLTVKADTGYVLDELTVTDKNGDEVKLTSKGNGKYTFTMPSGTVTVEASFVEGEEPDHDCPSAGYDDLSLSAWYHEAVDFVLGEGMMSGVSQHEFAPNSTLTRGMLVQILWAMEDKPQVNYLMKYNDVATSAWYAEAVRWASAEGIVSGYGDTFGPEDPITREQLALILYGYAKLNEADTEQGGMSIREYADYGRISSWALEAMDWAVNAGILSGKSASTLDPTGTATRAEAAQMLRNLCEIME